MILELVYIQPGRFDMGSSDDEDIADDDELPLHGVTIEYPLYVGKYEVTQAQWVAVMGTAEGEGEGHPPQEGDSGQFQGCR